MKPALRYLLIAGLALTALLLVLFYREYLGEDPSPDTGTSTNPLIKQRLNAIVTDTTVRTGKPGSRTLTVDYTDLDSREVSSFSIDYRNHAPIAIGDTVTKDRGDKLLFIYGRQGVASVPID